MDSLKNHYYNLWNTFFMLMQANIYVKSTETRMSWHAHTNISLDFFLVKSSEILHVLVTNITVLVNQYQQTHFQNNNCKYTLWSPALHNFLQFALTSSLTDLHNLLCTRSTERQHACKPTSTVWQKYCIKSVDDGHHQGILLSS